MAAVEVVLQTLRMTIFAHVKNSANKLTRACRRSGNELSRNKRTSVGSANEVSRDKRSVNEVTRDKRSVNEVTRDKRTLRIRTSRHSIKEGEYYIHTYNKILAILIIPVHTILCSES